MFIKINYDYLKKTKLKYKDNKIIKNFNFNFKKYEDAFNLLILKI